MALSDVLGLLAGSFGAGLSEYGSEQQRRAEMERKRQEEERIKQATQALFRGGDVTPEMAGAAITAGVSPTVVGSAQMFGRRQETEQAPVLTVQPYKRETGPTRTDMGAGEVFYTQFLNDPMLANNPAERNARVLLAQQLRQRYPQASVGELGLMLRAGSMSRRIPASPNDTEW